MTKTNDFDDLPQNLFYFWQVKKNDSQSNEMEGGEGCVETKTPHITCRNPDISSLFSHWTLPYMRDQWCESPIYWDGNSILLSEMHTARGKTNLTGLLRPPAMCLSNVTKIICQNGLYLSNWDINLTVAPLPLCHWPVKFVRNTPSKSHFFVKWLHSCSHTHSPRRTRRFDYWNASATSLWARSRSRCAQASNLTETLRQTGFSLLKKLSHRFE